MSPYPFAAGAVGVIAAAAAAQGSASAEHPQNQGNPYSGLVTWKPGSGVTVADSDEFALTLAGMLQLQWVFAANELLADTNTFLVRRAQVRFAGHAFGKDLAYLLRLEAVDDGTGTNGPVKDAWVQWTFARGDDAAVGARVGQGKTYHGLESTGGATGLWFVERASSSRAFADARSRGAWLQGSHAGNRLRWLAGAQNGDVANGALGITERGEETPNADNELTWVASASYDPFGDTTGGKNSEAWRQGDLRDQDAMLATVGAGVMFGNNRSAAAANQDIESTQINVNTAWSFGSGFAAQGEVYLRSDDPSVAPTEDSHGWYAQATWSTPKSGASALQWGFGVRYNVITTDDTVTFLTGANGLGAVAGEVRELTVVVDAFHHGHACKTQVEYTHQDVEPDSGTNAGNDIVRVQVQLMF